MKYKLLLLLLFTFNLGFSQLDSITFYHPNKSGKLLKIEKKENYLKTLDSLERKYNVRINSYFYIKNGEVWRCRRKLTREEIFNL